MFLFRGFWGVASLFENQGMIGKTVTALVTPRTVTVNDKFPVGSPSGSLTMM
jgi:hypothetical protein